MKTTIEIENLKKEIKKVIVETIQQEMMKLRGDLLPYISNEEQKDIEKLYKKPSFIVGKTKKAHL